MTKRFAQLTYTSFEPEDGSRGGWQIRESSVGLSSSERDLALSHVPAEMRLAKPLSKYPTAEETRTLPRRLLYLRPGGESGLYVHSCPAGTDGSGRDGNIFTHVLVDRDMAAMLEGRESHRPIELWRSARWLTPYGVGEVRSARIAEDRPPQPDDGQRTRKRTAEFICSRPDRLYGLGALVDAAVIASEGGPRVLIVAQDVDEGVAWLAAVTMLAGSGAALSFSFSTLESSVDLRTKGPKAVLSVVLRAEVRVLIASLPPGVVVVDPAQQAEPSGGRWVPVAGPAFAESSWSKLVSVLGRAGVRGLNDRMLAVDELSHINSHLGVTRPEWALAVALAEEPRLVEDWEVLANVILRGTPPGELPGDTKRAVRTLLQHRVVGTDGLIGLLDDEGTLVANEDLILEVYVLHLKDVVSLPERLLGADPAPVPYWPALGRPDLTGRLLAALHSPLGEAVAGGVDDTGQSVRALRVLDLLLRAGVQYDPSWAVLGELLTQGLTGLASRDAEAVVKAVGPLSAELGEVMHAVEAAAQPSQVSRHSTWAPADQGQAGLAPPPERGGWRAELDRTGNPKRIGDAVAALSAAPESDAPPSDWTWNVLRQVGEGAIWSVEDLVAVAEGIGPRDHVDLTAEACAAMLDAGLRYPSARLAQLVVEHNDAGGRTVDDYQSNLLWLSRVLGDKDRWVRLSDPRTAARLLRLGLSIGRDRDHVEEEQWERWAPALVVAAARLMGLTPVHLDHSQVLSELDGVDVTARLVPIIETAGGQVCDWLLTAMVCDAELTRGVVLAAWCGAQGSATRGAVSPNLLSVAVDGGAGHLSLAEAVIGSIIAQGPERHAWLSDTVAPSVSPSDWMGITGWLQQLLSRPVSSPTEEP